MAPYNRCLGFNRGHMEGLGVDTDFVKYMVRSLL